MRGERLLAHRGVGAERDERREAADAAVQDLVDRRYQQRQRAAAGAVWHQHAHAAPVQVRGLELVVHERPDVSLGEDVVRPADLRYCRGRRTGRLSHDTPRVSRVALLAAEGCYHRLYEELYAHGRAREEPGAASTGEQPDATEITSYCRDYGGRRDECDPDQTNSGSAAVRSASALIAASFGPPRGAARST